MGRSVDGLLGAVVFVTVGIPTIIFYAWPIGCAVFAARAKDARATWLFAGLALLPITLYGAQYLSVYVAHRGLDAIVGDAQNSSRLANPPRVLVVHGFQQYDWQGQLVEMGAFDEVYVEGPKGIVRLANARAPVCEQYGRRETLEFYRSRMGFVVCAVSTAVDHVPEGLHLYVASLISPALEPQQWSSALELRLVENGQRRMIGFWGIPRVHYPAFPPILSLAGFYINDVVQKSPVPYYGELTFLLERLDIDPEHLKPRDEPAPEEVRAAFLRRVNSSDIRELRAAGYIAVAAGAAALTADDVELLLGSKNSGQFWWGDAAREVGHQQFCYDINRLCDFAPQLVASCQRNRRPRRDRTGATDRIGMICERIVAQCNWCATKPLCQPTLTGRSDRCTAEDAQSREVALDRILGR